MPALSLTIPCPHTLQQSRPQLRRAVYVHVSDLTSSYNIDHSRLEEELKRVQAERKRKNTVETKAGSGSSNELDSVVSAKRLQPPRGGYNLCLLVGSVQVVVDKFRVDGSRVRLAEVEVGDETGTVSLRARDDQIDLLSQVSERKGAVVLRNSTLELYQGKHIRLAVTKWGKLTPYPDQVASTPAPPSRMNNERYFSLIDLSVVASDMVLHAHSDYASSRQKDYEIVNQGIAQRNRTVSGNRRPNNTGRGKTGTPGRHAKATKQPVYGDNSAGVLRYSGGYGYHLPDVDSQTQAQAMFGFQSIRQRQQEAQQMMIQQYQMMHYQPPSPEHVPGPGTAPLLLPAVSPPAFEARFGTSPDSVRQAPPRSFPAALYGGVMPVCSSGGGNPRTHSNQEARSSLSGGLQSIDSPRMNPRAPTFDPTYRSTGKNTYEGAP